VRSASFRREHPPAKLWDSDRGQCRAAVLNADPEAARGQIGRQARGHGFDQEDVFGAHRSVLGTRRQPFHGPSEGSTYGMRRSPNHVARPPSATTKTGRMTKANHSKPVTDRNPLSVICASACQRAGRQINQIMAPMTNECERE
jgi:hypothetical protein